MAFDATSLYSLAMADKNAGCLASEAQFLQRKYMNDQLFSRFNKKGFEPQILQK